MKILHTADLHLNEKNDRRWDAFGELVNLASREQVAALIIAGDLFDQDVAAENMRGRLRSVLGAGAFQTIIIPGNHDCRAFRSGLFFGENVFVISDWRKPVCLGDTAFWGLPHADISAGALAARLREMALLMDSARENILLFHGELLDTFFTPLDTGQEGTRRCMPARLSFFEPLPVSYVLAGHFHSRYAAWQIEKGGLFIYPGSPVAVTRRETGRRKANLIDADQAPREVNLDSFHYEKLTVTLDPFSQQDPLSDLDHELDRLHPGARILLTVEGLFDSSALYMSEAEMAAEIRQKTKQVGADEPVFNFVDVRHVLEDDLFKKFRAFLTETDLPPELKKEVEAMVIQAFRGVARCS